MANYYASSRTSYVKVKDKKKFNEWEKEVPGRLIMKEDKEHGTLYGFCFDDDDCGGIPDSRYDEEKDDFVEFNIYEEIQPHISDGWAITFIEVGAEKLRYLVGHAVIVTQDTIESSGLSEWVDKTMKALGNPSHTDTSY